MRAMVYHFVIYLVRIFILNFIIETFNRQLKQFVKLNYVYFLKTKIVYITSEHSVIFLQPELTQYPVVSIHSLFFSKSLVYNPL